MPEENKSLILPKEKIPASISNSKSWNKEIPSSGHNSK